MHKFRIIALLGVLLDFVATTDGADLFNTSSSTLGVTRNPWTTDLKDAQFFKTTTDNLITMLQFKWTGSGVTGNVAVSSNADNASVPGSQVTQGGSFNLSTITNIFGEWVTFSSLNINLAANINYWVVFSGSSITGTSGLLYATNPIGVGGPFNIAENLGLGWTIYPGYAFIGQITATVPEPSKWALRLVCFSPATPIAAGACGPSADRTAAADRSEPLREAHSPGSADVTSAQVPTRPVATAGTGQGPVGAIYYPCVQTFATGQAGSAGSRASNSVMQAAM